VEAIDISTENVAYIQNNDELCAPLQHLLNKEPVEAEYTKKIKGMTDISQSCFKKIYLERE
jgi:hypothetical protein